MTNSSDRRRNSGFCPVRSSMTARNGPNFKVSRRADSRLSQDTGSRLRDRARTPLSVARASHLARAGDPLPKSVLLYWNHGSRRARRGHKSVSKQRPYRVRKDSTTYSTTQALKRSGGLEKLGEIIAADLFNGNTDRFGPPYNLNPGRGPGGIPLAAIYNVGNVFVACDGKGRGKPIGLDNFDPAGESKDVNSANLDKKQWGGMLLRPSERANRETYAGLIITDLEALLGPRNRKIPLGTTKRLGNARKARLTKGMVSGAKKLKTTLKAWLRKNPNSQFKAGIAAKMAALGW